MLLAFFEGRHALEWSAAGRDARKARVIQSLTRFFGTGSRGADRL